MKKILNNIPAAVLFFASVYFSIQPVCAQNYGPEQKITVQQIFPAAVRPGSDFVMEIKISKGNVTGLAKFQQYIPAGMTASSIDNAGADFSFESQNVKFIWTSVPQDASITLRYKVTVTPTLLGKKYLSGTFSYVENDRTKKISLVPKEIDINPAAPASEVAAAESKPAEESKPAATESKPSQEEVHNTKSSDASTALKDEPEPAEVVKTQPADNASSSSTSSSAPEATPEAKKEPVSFTPGETTAPSPATDAPATAERKAAPVETPDNVTAPAAAGITFKVQIAAMNEKHFRRKNYFQEKFGLQMEVAAEEHEGLKKYTVGSFTSYAEARKLRDEILSKVAGSFVVAYKDGVRIPVAEAMEMGKKK